MKKKFLRAVLSATLAATLCFASAMPTLALERTRKKPEEAATSTSVAVSAPTETSEAATSAETTDNTEAASEAAESTVGVAESTAADSEAASENAGSDAQAALLNNAVSQVNAQLEEMQNQLKKAEVEATLAVVFGFVALVLGVVALLISLRKTASANSGARGGIDNGAGWKKLNQSIQQIEHQLQQLAQKQEKALEAARTYTSESAAPLQSTEQTVQQHVPQPSRSVEQSPAMKWSPAVEQPPVQGPQVLGYLVYEKNYRGEMVPTVKELPGAGKIQMKVLSDCTVVVDEELLKDHYEATQHLIDAGLDRVFDITVAGLAYQSQMLTTLGALKLKKMQRAAQVELAPDGVKITACGNLEFEQMDYS